MTSADIAALSAAVQIRQGAQWLIQATNDTAAATTINTTRLEAACQDSLGSFERLAKITADATNTSQLPILIEGVLYFLEKYKSRDSNVIRDHEKSFIAGCKDFAALGWIEPVTSSTLSPSQEAANSRPDMDRAKKVWHPSTTIRNNEIANFSE